MQSSDRASSCEAGVAGVVAVPVSDGFPAPRFESYPSGDESKALAALKFWAAHGLVLDGHQRHVFAKSCRTRADGKWAAPEVGWVEPRQNGKTEVLIVRGLSGLFLWGDELVTHSAHRLDTAEDAFRRIVEIVEGHDDLMERVRKVTRTNGKYAIELVTGARMQFRSRSTGGGLGFTGDTVIYDEAMFLAEEFHGALMPTLSARSITGNPQQWFAGSAVDQWVHENGVVFSRVRERGIAGADRLAFFEWSAPFDCLPHELTREQVLDRSWWPLANPAFGVRISEEWIATELDSMDNRRAAVMRACVGDWPRTDGLVETVVSISDWMNLVAEGTMAEPLIVAFDVSPERLVSVAVAGRRDDGFVQVEVPAFRMKPGELPAYLAGMLERREVTRVLCDAHPGAASLIAACAEAGVDVEGRTAPEMAQACARFVDAVNEQRMRHLGSDEVLNALRGARQRPLGDAWAWSRKNSSTDIAPLVAVTMAVAAMLDEPEGGNEIVIW